MIKRKKPKMFEEVSVIKEKIVSYPKNKGETMLEGFKKMFGIRKSKGQFLVVSLITTIMVLFAFMAIYPVLKARIDASVVGMDVYAATLLQLSPFFILLSLILTIIFAALPVRE